MPPKQKRRRIAANEREDNPDAQSEEDGPRQTQARARRIEEDSEDETERYGDTTGQEGTLDDNSSDHDQLVKKLVRYALSCEYSRQPIRREGIREKVFGKQRTPFKAVFEAAQQELREKFGMVMIELPVKEKVLLKDRLAAQKVSQTPTSSNSYVLTSTLPPQYRVPAILSPSAIPDSSNEAAYIALYTMIISLITLNGGKIGEPKLNSYLARMNAEVNMPMDSKDNVMAKMVKQGYLVRIRDNTNDAEIIEWTVGPRGKVEVGDKGVEGLVLEAYGEEAPDDLADRIKKSLGMSGMKIEGMTNPAGTGQNGGRSQANVSAPNRGRRRAQEDNDSGQD